MSTLMEIALVALLVVVFLPLLIWFIRVRPRQPQLVANCNSDCEFITTTDLVDSKITFRNVRNFFWRTTKDRDESWIDELTVDS